MYLIFIVYFFGNVLGRRLILPNFLCQADTKPPPPPRKKSPQWKCCGEQNGIVRRQRIASDNLQICGCTWLRTEFRNTRPLLLNVFINVSVPGIDHGCSTPTTPTLFMSRCRYMTFLAEAQVAIIPDNNTFCTFITINNGCILRWFMLNTKRT